MKTVIRHKKEIINIFAIGLMLVITILFFITFIYCYQQGYYLNISINDYGEANLEIIVLSIIMVLGCYSLGYNLRKYKRMVKHENKN